MRDAMVAGVWGNSNYDAQKEGEQGARKELLEYIETQYKDALREVYADPAEKRKEVEEEDIWKKPFFAASKAPRIRTGDAPVRPEPEKQKFGHAAQDEERKRLIAALDQN